MLPELDFTLVKGVGDYANKKACVVSAAVAYWRLSNGIPLGTATDDLDCICPVVQSFMRRLNDSACWDSEGHRTSALMPFVPRILNTRNDSLLQERSYMLADWAIRDASVRILQAKSRQYDSYLDLLNTPNITDCDTAVKAAWHATNLDRFAAAASGFSAALVHGSDRTAKINAQLSAQAAASSFEEARSLSIWNHIMLPSILDIVNKLLQPTA
jgi:hypothetical protein